VNGVGIVRYPDAVPGQLVPKSYRPRAGGRRRCRQGPDAPLQLLRAADERLPDPLAARRVERREDLAAAGVGDCEVLPLDPGLPHPAPDRVQRADPGCRLAEAGAEPAGGRDPDPKPGEGAGAEPDADQVDRLPTARDGGTALDLLEQSGGVLRPTLGGGAEQRLAEDLAVAPGAGGSVLGRGVEADDDQRCVASRP
jgi:hypothetical protein